MERAWRRIELASDSASSYLPLSISSSGFGSATDQFVG